MFFWGFYLIPQNEMPCSASAIARGDGLNFSLQQKGPPASLIYAFCISGTGQARSLRYGYTRKPYISIFSLHAPFFFVGCCCPELLDPDMAVLKLTGA